MRVFHKAWRISPEWGTRYSTSEGCGFGRTDLDLGHESSTEARDLEAEADPGPYSVPRLCGVFRSGWTYAPAVGSEVVWRETRRCPLRRSSTGPSVRRHVHGDGGLCRSACRRGR